MQRTQAEHNNKQTRTRKQLTDDLYLQVMSGKKTEKKELRSDARKRKEREAKEAEERRLAEEKEADKAFGPGRRAKRRACAYEDCQEKRAVKRCSRCKWATYCSRECQLKDWKSHKQYCEEPAGSTIKHAECMRACSNCGRPTIGTCRDNKGGCKDGHYERCRLRGTVYGRATCDECAVVFTFQCAKCHFIDMIASDSD